MKCQDKLKDTVRLVFTDLNLAILSLRFLLSTLGLSCCYVLFIFSHISTMGGFANVLSEDFISVLYLMDVSIIGMGVNLIIFCVIPIIPYGSSICYDLNEHFYQMWIIRTGVKQYVCSKFLACFCSGFLCLLMGQILTMFLLLGFAPLYNNLYDPANSYVVFLNDALYIKYVLVYFSHISLTGALYATIGMFLSLFIANKMVVFSMPVLCYFAVLRILSTFFASAARAVSYITEVTYSEISPFSAFMKKLIIITGICLMLIGISIRKMKKRVEA